MKNFFRRSIHMLKQVWCWSLLLTLVGCALIFFVGPLIAIAGKTVLAALDTRILVMVLMLACWLVALLVAQPIRRSRRRRMLNAEQLKTELENDEQIDDELHLLKERLNKAISVVKHSSFYGKRRASRYELPWYLLMGDQGSGKTALLENASVDFPLNKTDERMTRDIGHTKYCEWYFANQAVMIDASGRYMLQEENSVAAKVWPQFLQMLYQKRRRRPLNGIVFTLDVAQLMNQNEQALEQYARTVRGRVQQIQSQLCSDIPVYLVLSKGDYLEGFHAFFEQLTKEEREQIVGVTFKENTDGTQVDVLRAEFEELIRRINDMVLSRIHSERDVKRRGDIIRFPLQFAAIVESLALFVEIAFGRNRYHLPTRLRGIYLTSTPDVAVNQQLDESTISIGRNIGLQRDLLPRAAQNQGFFIRRVLEDVVFSEGDLATVDTRYERGMRWTNRFAYLSALVVVLGIGSTWMRVFYDNSGRQQTLRDLYTHVKNEQQKIAPISDAPAVLPVLRTLREATRVYPQSNRADWVYKLSLHQGNRINPVVEKAYEQQLRQLMLPKIKQLLEEQLRAGSDDRDYLLKALRAYLMLHDKSHLDNTYLRHWISLSWADLYNGQASLQNNLLDHFDTLLKIGFEPTEIDYQLVEDTQHLLKQESPAKLVYRMIKEDPLAVTLPVVHFDDVQGMQYRSFIGGDYNIPGLYTQRGYQDVFLRKGLSLIKEIMQDNWVLGTSDDMSEREFQKVYADVENLYFQDYISYWSEAVGQLQLKGMSDLSDASNMLNNLNNNQPMQRMLALIRDNTSFAVPEVVSDEAEAAVLKKTGKGKLAKALVAKAGSALEEAQSKGPKQAVALKFAPYHQLMLENGTPSPAFQDALSALNTLQSMFTELAHAPDQDAAAYQLASNRMSGHPDELTQLRVAADRLPEPMRSWFIDIADQSWAMTLDKATNYVQLQYRTDVYAVYANTIRGRYPFTDTDKDVALGDFNEFFKKGGVLDQFVKGPLKPFFFVRGNELLSRSIDGQNIQLSRRTLQQFRQAVRIQKAFFADEGGQAAVQFKVQPLELAPSALKSEFAYSGQSLVYQHGPIVPIDLSWPMSQGRSAASISMQDLSGKESLLVKQSGPWSLFRLLDHCEVRDHAGEDQLEVIFDNHGAQVQYLFSSSHSPNPLQRGLLAGFELTNNL
jgi:type VI secretion system protein ImpL